MSSVVSMRLRDEQLYRLKRYARSLGKSPGEVSAMMVEERLREAEFALIEFRPSEVGRQAYMKGSRLPVWWVIRAAKEYGLDEARLAEQFGRPTAWARAAVNYYRAFPEEVDLAIDDYSHVDIGTLKRLLPGLEVVEVPASEAP